MAGTAREKFTSGQRVEMTRLAIRQGLEGRRKAVTGVVVGFHPLAPKLIQVKRDGYKRPDIWHVDMWTPLADSEDKL